MQEKWQCKIAPSLGGGFAGTPNETWGTVDYTNDTAPAVFFGLYGLPDFFALWRHKGRKAILWAGSDITHFINGYWLDDEGDIRISHEGLAKWINLNCESYVENEVERDALVTRGVSSQVVPSFLGDINSYQVEFKPNNRYYTSVSGDDFLLYGWDKIDAFADLNPKLEFHLYGNRKPWKTQMKNVFIHGRVPQEQMNFEVKQMQGGLRLTKFDGFSEILAKSVLWGQRPVSPYIHYPHIDTVFKKHTEPNLEGRDFYKEHLNKYPWCQK